MPRPFSVQEPKRPPKQEEIENEAFQQNKFEAFGLQLKEKHGTITPIEQERLGVLQAKMDSFWAQRMEQGKAQPNLLEILIHNAQTQPVPLVQPKLNVEQSNDNHDTVIQLTRTGKNVGRVGGAVIGGVAGSYVGGSIGMVVGAALGGYLGGYLGDWWTGYSDFDLRRNFDPPELGDGTTFFIPKGTHLFHGTRWNKKDARWWETSYPGTRNDEDGGVSFAIDPKETPKISNASVILRYTLNQDTKVIYKSSKAGFK